MSDTELLNWMESRCTDGARWYVTDHGLVERASAKGLARGDVERHDRFRRTLREAITDAEKRMRNAR